MIMPDSYLVLFWVCAIYFLLDFITEKPSKTSGIQFIIFGVFVGLAMLSKYHSIMLWAGAGMYILVYNRDWLKSKYFYFAMIISMLFTIPIIFGTSQLSILVLPSTGRELVFLMVDLDLTFSDWRYLERFFTKTQLCMPLF